MDDLDGVVRWPVMTEPYVLAVPRDCASEATKDFSKLIKDLPLIRWSSHSNIGIQIETQLRRMRLEIPRRFEFESAGSILGMVASGLGCAIVTPLLIFESRTMLHRIRILPFPGPSFSRQIDLVTRHGEIDQLGEEICRVTCRILREQYLPAMIKAAPAMQNRIVIGGELRDRSKARGAPARVPSHR
jgi:DNA-binding transcriptional LysR family regulator